MALEFDVQFDPFFFLDFGRFFFFSVKTVGDSGMFNNELKLHFFFLSVIFLREHCYFDRKLATKNILLPFVLKFDMQFDL